MEQEPARVNERMETGLDHWALNLEIRESIDKTRVEGVEGVVLPSQQTRDLTKMKVISPVTTVSPAPSNRPTIECQAGRFCQPPLLEPPP